MNTSLRATRRTVRGFTLMEMILVLAIISLLVGLGIYSLTNVGTSSEMVAANANVHTLDTNLIRYKTMAGALPSQAQGLKALTIRPSGDPAPNMWVQCVEPNALIDPWGKPYQYRNPGKRKTNGYDVYSLGPDGVDGTEDDIGNWKP